MDTHIRASLEEAQAALKNLLANETTLRAINDAGALLVDTFKKGGRVFSCGNGGSMCDAMHFAEELSGRYRLDRAGLPAPAGDQHQRQKQKRPNCSRNGKENGREGDRHDGQSGFTARAASRY
jgi:hypothetical protein